MEVPEANLGQGLAGGSVALIQDGDLLGGEGGGMLEVAGKARPAAVVEVVDEAGAGLEVGATGNTEPIFGIEPAWMGKPMGARRRWWVRARRQ